MSSPLAQVIVILLLIGLNGVFAMAEFAVVGARKQRLRQQAGEGDRGAAVALDLAESPNRFLSTVQVGVTLISVLTGLIGGAALGADLATELARVAWLAPYSRTLAYGLVVAAITYLSVLLGELVPKRIALARPERVAVLLAPAMRLFAALAAPVVRLFSVSSRFVMRLLGVTPSAEPPVTDEEIRMLFEEGTEAGVFEEAEQEMVRGVLLLGDRRASSLMTARPEMVWVDIDDTPDEVRRKLEESSFSRFPVARGSLDQVIGEVQAKDMLIHVLKGHPLEIAPLVRKPLFVPEVMPVLSVLETFKQAGRQMALVINEYGGVEGLLTHTDILEAIVGDIPSADEVEEPEAIQRDDGSWLVDGLLPIDEMKRHLGIEETLPDEEQGLYQTVAGFVILQLGHLPGPTDHFEWGNMRFEVLSMAGPRVHKVLVSFLPGETQDDGHDVTD